MRRTNILLLILLSITLVYAGDCGTTCSADTDCPLSRCNTCVAGVCTSDANGCTASCQTNDDCTSKRCSYCKAPGFCVPGGACNSRCEVDSDCNMISNCRHCINNECVAQCGNACENNDQCEFGCKRCDHGICVRSIGEGGGGGGGGGSGGECTDEFLEVIVRIPKSVGCVN